MKKLLLASLVLAVAAPAFAVPTNQGPDRPVPADPNDISDDLGGGSRVLYAPSEGDDAAFRGAIATAIGGTCDYFDAISGTPDAALLAGYDCVMTWANFAYADADGFGNNLAAFVDNGGAVVLGAFAVYTSGNSLGGAIVTPAYCPVSGGFNNFFFASYAGDGSGCWYTGVGGFGATYRDILSLQGAGAINGTFTDGEIAGAYNTGSGAPAVVYANGAGGFPIDGNGPDWPQFVANGCTCFTNPIPTVETSWGRIKSLY
jgi:hypothetical protein